MEKILTISIAAYNVEKYIKQTLDSIVDEKLIDDLEVFVIDDGGTDHTLDIAKEYAVRYPNSIFPVHKENGGYGTTVNYSIAHANGRYFKLLDGDDWFDIEALRRLISQLKSLKEDSIDAVILPYRKGPNEDKLEDVSLDGHPWGKTVSLSEISGERPFSMWSIVYSTKMLKACGLELPPHLMYTDQLYSVIPLTRCRKIYFLKEYVYCYRVGREEQSTSKISKIKHASDMLFIVERLCKFYSEHAEEDGVQSDYIVSRISKYYFQAIKTLLLKPVTKQSINEVKAFEENIKSIAPKIYMNATNYGKLGFLIRLSRKTNYRALWLIKISPWTVKSWQ